MDRQYTSFNPAFNYAHSQAPTMDYPEAHYAIYQTYHGLQYMYPSHAARDQLLHERVVASDGKTESKPRLSKEEVEKLEKVFQENPKPSSSVKAQLADALGLERPRINNWFQNRRAKAKQEKKQEEYEARKAAEHGGEEDESGDDFNESTGTDYEDAPNMPMATLPTTLTDESHASEKDAASSRGYESPFSGAPSSASPIDDQSAEFQSPLSLNFTQPGQGHFVYTLPSQSFANPASVQGWPPLASSQQSSAGRSDQTTTTSITYEGLPSPEEQTGASDYQADRYLKLVRAGYPSSSLPLYSTGMVGSQRPLETCSEENEAAEDVCLESVETGHGAHALPQGIPTPTDSFESPPPSADIASRRKLQRPAALQTASLRSRSYNLGSGPKSSLDSPRRADPASPATAMRRIASASGPLTGRIQKQTSNPRSPMFLGRNTEAYLQFQSRGTMGTLSSTLGSTAPPTPMTPMVVNQLGGLEPRVNSNCSDDEAFMLGTGMTAAGFIHDLRTGTLKTPPGTPGIVNNFVGTNFNANPFSTGVDFSADQALVTPFLQSDFPDMSLNVPSYVDLSDSSLPSTPLYANIMSAAQEAGSIAGSSQAGTREYDWDANESVTSSKSSPGQPRSSQIHFTQNMTPQDYTFIPEK